MSFWRRGVGVLSFFVGFLKKFLGVFFGFWGFFKFFFGLFFFFFWVLKGVCLFLNFIFLVLGEYVANSTFRYFFCKNESFVPSWRSPPGKETGGGRPGPGRKGAKRPKGRTVGERDPQAVCGEMGNPGKG